MPDYPTRPITATMLVDLWSCERRFELDLVGDPALRDEPGDFVRMLWKEGLAHEHSILSGIEQGAADLRNLPWERRGEATARAVAARQPLILGALIAKGDLLGMPDMLELTVDGYASGDVKSGAAEMVRGDGARPKIEYGLQLAHYGRILDALGWGSAAAAFIIGRSGERSPVDFRVPVGLPGASLSETHTRLLDDARIVMAGGRITRPAASAQCGMCHWRTFCREQLRSADDPTLLPQVGRALRDRLPPALGTVAAIAGLEPTDYSADGRSTLPGIGLDRLVRMRDRARLLSTAGAAPYARRPLDLPVHAHELHLDLESDPLGGNQVYLHGVWERVRTSSGMEEAYHHFLTDGPADEGRVFADAIGFLRARPTGHVYVWSRFERTSYRMLQDRYPGVCSPAEVEALFSPARCTDLYSDVVLPDTEWPLGSYGLKAVAGFLGFRWNAADAGGAASIGWYREWQRGRDSAVLERILDYNRSDVIATSLVLDRLRQLEVNS